jgi:CHAT domain-containing protein/tetratricopeptide (TPR) repeat protein
VSALPHSLGLKLLLLGALLLSLPAQAFTLPPSCTAQPPALAPTEALPVLRQRLIAITEEDPTAAVRLICATLPRVAWERGEHSAELAWWTAALATPLIAYFDKFDEAIPLLQFAEPILEQNLSRYPNEVADIHVAYAWIYFRQGRLAESGRAWEQALAVRERAPGAHQIELQKVLVGLAQVRTAQRDFPAARTALARAERILVANHATVSEAAAAIESLETNLALREEDFHRARTHAQAQIRIERQLTGGAPQLVPAYVQLGTIHARLEDFEASEAALREAIRLSESATGPLQRHRLRALNQTAALLAERDRSREALPFAQRALEVGETTLGPSAPNLIGVLRTLADVERALGNLRQALRLYDRAGEIVARSRPDVELQVLIAYYAGRGSLELELGDAASAREALLAALEAAGGSPNLAFERGRVLLALAQTAELGDPLRRRRLEEALELFRSRLPDSHPTVLRVINELCTVEIAERRDSAPRCQEALARVESARDVEPTLRSAVFRNQSELAAQRGDDASAFSAAQRAVAAAEAVGTPGPLWQAYLTLAAALRRREELPLAIFFGKRSLGEIEQLRGDFAAVDSGLERSFLGDKGSAYRTVADWLMETGRIDEGLEVLALLKTQELYDYELRAAVAGPRTAVSLTESERQLHDHYSMSLSGTASGGELEHLLRLREHERLKPEERDRLESLLVTQASGDAERVERIHAFLETSAPAGAGAAVPGTGVRADRLKTELARFGPDAVLGVFLLTPSRLRVLIASRQSQTELEVTVDARQLQRDVGHFLAGISERRDVQAESRGLYELVARPLDEAAHRAHARRLVLWLDGPLRYLPFAALHDGKRYLLQKYALQWYAGPAPAEGPGTAGRALRVRGMGVTQAVGGFEALPAIADELCDVVRGPISGLVSPGSRCTSPGTGNGALPGEGFADGAFTETRLRSVLQGPLDYAVLHVGTHFSLRAGNVLRSFLVLGDGSHLTLDTLSALHFSGLDLVTLSGCQTGLGGAVGEDGREVEGLSAIVQRAGARQVIASLWQVEDRSTAALMRRMYEALVGTHGDGALALRQAQLSILDQSAAGTRPYSHPFYWAGFTASTR